MYVFINKTVMLSQYKQPEKTDYYHYLVSNDSLKLFFSLSRIDDWKARIEKVKIWQVDWTEQVGLNRIIFTNVVIFDSKNF